MELRDFETALKSGVKGTEKTESGEPVGEGLQPFSLEEPKEEGKAEYSESMKDRMGDFTFEEFREEERKQPPESGEKAFQALTLEEPKEEGKAEYSESRKDRMGDFPFEEFREEEHKQPPESSEKAFQALTLEEPGEEEGTKPAESMFDEIQSFIRNELRKETPLEIAPGLSELPEIPVGSERTPAAKIPLPVEIDFEEEALGELAEEEFPDSFIEELGEDEIHVIEEPGQEPVEVKEEEVKIFHEEVPSGFPQNSNPQVLFNGFNLQASSERRKLPKQV